MEKSRIVLPIILVFVAITCPLPFLVAFFPGLPLHLPSFSIYLPTCLIVGMIILLVGIPLAFALSDYALLTATIFSLIEVLATFVYPYICNLLDLMPPDFSILYVLLSIGWWLYFLFIGWRWES
jgi:hypothetical protein